MNPHPSQPFRSPGSSARGLLDQLDRVLDQLDRPALLQRERRALRRQGLQAVQDLRVLVHLLGRPDPQDEPGRQDHP